MYNTYIIDNTNAIIEKRVASINEEFIIDAWKILNKYILEDKKFSFVIERNGIESIDFKNYLCYVVSVTESIDNNKTYILTHNLKDNLIYSSSHNSSMEKAVHETEKIINQKIDEQIKITENLQEIIKNKHVNSW